MIRAGSRSACIECLDSGKVRAGHEKTCIVKTAHVEAINKGSHFVSFEKPGLWLIYKCKTFELTEVNMSGKLSINIEIYVPCLGRR